MRPSKGLRVALIAIVTVAVPLLAAAAPAGASMHAAPAYRLRELPSLGGLLSTGIGINDRGWVSGASDLAGDTITRAALWRHGRVTDLNTLGGANSAVVFSSHSDRFVVGVAETSRINPDGEDWSCATFFVGPATHHDCVGFIWRAGRLRALPTLGGPNGFAAGSNRAGQIVGWAENRTKDPSCTGTQVRQFRAVVWDARTLHPHELRPLPGDSTSAAVAINDRGQVVGISGACGTAVGGVSARHAVLWDEHGTPHNLGDIGGTQWNTPVAINNRDQVVGFANVPGGATPASLYPHAFLWTPRSGMHDLGTLPGDTLSEGLGINDGGQIVGESCQAHLVDCRAVLWQDRKTINLNDLTSTHAATLTNAGDINDAGEITGTASDNGTNVAYLARPLNSPDLKRSRS